MMDKNKSEDLLKKDIARIKEVIASAKTFTGFNLHTVPIVQEPEGKKDAWLRRSNEEKNYLRIMDKGVECFLPKNVHAISINSGGGVWEDVKRAWNSPYDARGLSFDNLGVFDLVLLKKVFGDELIQGNQTAMIFTHIDRKSAVELAAERGLTAAGAIVAAPAIALGMGVAGLVKVNPGLAKSTMATHGGVALAAVASVGVGLGVSMVPKLIDKIEDKLNGDERVGALEYAISSLVRGKPATLLKVAEDVPVVSKMDAKTWKSWKEINANDLAKGSPSTADAPALSDHIKNFLGSKKSSDPVSNNKPKL